MTWLELSQGGLHFCDTEEVQVSETVYVIGKHILKRKFKEGTGHPSGEFERLLQTAESGEFKPELVWMSKNASSEVQCNLYNKLLATYKNTTTEQNKNTVT